MSPLTVESPLKMKSLSVCVCLCPLAGLSEERCEHFHLYSAFMRRCTCMCMYPLVQECWEERCGPSPLPPMDSAGSNREREGVRVRKRKVEKWTQDGLVDKYKRSKESWSPVVLKWHQRFYESCSCLRTLRLLRSFWTYCSLEEDTWGSKYSKCLLVFQNVG